MHQVTITYLIVSDKTTLFDEPTYSDLQKILCRKCHMLENKKNAIRLTQIGCGHDSLHWKEALMSLVTVLKAQTFPFHFFHRQTHIPIFRNKC